MRQYQPYSAVVAALRESKFLEVTGPEGMEEIKRKTPYDPDRKDNRMPRSIYAKGFGEETPTSQFDIEAFFAEHGPTNVVRLRRTEDTKLFKGSVFVEFADEETATKFLALDPKPMWQGKHELQIMSKLEYVTTKKNAILDGTLIPNTTRSTSHRGRGGRNFDRRGDRDPDDWKKRREDDQKSGFRDNKRGRGHRGHGSRGGQGRGRGDRRNDDRNRERNGEDR
jgi:lupus La protein